MARSACNASSFFIIKASIVTSSKGWSVCWALASANCSISCRFSWVVRSTSSCNSASFWEAIFRATSNSRSLVVIRSSSSCLVRSNSSKRLRDSTVAWRNWASCWTKASRSWTTSWWAWRFCSDSKSMADRTCPDSWSWTWTRANWFWSFTSCSMNCSLWRINSSRCWSLRRITSSSCWIRELKSCWMAA